MQQGRYRIMRNRKPLYTILVALCIAVAGTLITYRWLMDQASRTPMVVEKRLILTATERPKGARRSSQARAKTTKRGLPGGCGMPRMWAVAMYSLVSQKAVVGARVTTYRNATPSVAMRAHT